MVTTLIEVEELKGGSELIDRYRLLRLHLLNALLLLLLMLLKNLVRGGILVRQKANFIGR